MLEKWSAPGIYAGNEMPGYIDNAGSVSRRFFVFPFDTIVMEKDTKLDGKLAMELPSIILKCNRAYLERVEEVGSGDIWKNVPDFFDETRRDVAAACNPLEDFISSGKLEFGENSFIGWPSFTAAFFEHARENGLRERDCTLKADTYNPILTRNKLRKIKMCERLVGKERVRSEWVEGCCLPTEGTEPTLTSSF